MRTSNTKDLRGPSAATLAKLLAEQPHSAQQCVFDIAELADKAGAQRLEIVLDERGHPQQSLLTFELAAFQGPALCFHIPGDVVPYGVTCAST